jgi:hypothetical protein
MGNIQILICHQRRFLEVRTLQADVKLFRQLTFKFSVHTRPDLQCRLLARTGHCLRGGDMSAVGVKPTLPKPTPMSPNGLSLTFKFQRLNIGFRGQSRHRNEGCLHIFSTQKIRDVRQAHPNCNR